MSLDHTVGPRRLRAAAVLIAAGLVVAACSPGTGTPSAPASGTAAPPSGTTAPATAPATAASTGGTVPDAFTAVTVRPLSESTFPFLGSDGKYHVVYDLELTNAAPIPATVDRVDVADAANPGTVLASYSGTALVAPDCPYGDCNRLRRLPSSPATDTAFGAQEARALLVDFTVDSPQSAPKAVVHHLYGTGAVNPVPGPGRLRLPRRAVRHRRRNPAGDRPAGQGRTLGRAQRVLPARLPAPHLARHVQRQAGQRPAVRHRLEADQRRTASSTPATGPRTRATSTTASTIYAVADGTITARSTSSTPTPPGVLPADRPGARPKLTVQTVDGNHIVVGHRRRRLRLLRAPGEGLAARQARRQGQARAQVIAKLGNTGNANASHMHFHLMNGPSVLGSDGLPYVIDRFTYAGQVAPQASDRRRRLPERAVPAGPPADPATAHRPAALRAGHRRLPRLQRLRPGRPTSATRAPTPSRRTRPPRARRRSAAPSAARRPRRARCPSAPPPRAQPERTAHRTRSAGPLGHCRPLDTGNVDHHAPRVRVGGPTPRSDLRASTRRRGRGRGTRPQPHRRRARAERETSRTTTPRGTE